ncbi:hypothetical protein C8R44DRAFT_879182 [Mycena epipterygia]|nr:hypothetical protein C8R44DRAFT_879182 [Mycena epipterygia]
MAHHSPAGFQGPIIVIQDGFTIAWKFTFSTNSTPRLLMTCDAERLPSSSRCLASRVRCTSPLVPIGWET